MKNRKGFTIVELVIVIAVIAILAAVLIPTFSGVISKANDSAALQTARSTLTNALNMSSTAQLSGQLTSKAYTTMIVVDGHAYGYTGNELVAINYPSSTETVFKLASTITDTTDNSNRFNSILIAAENLTYEGGNASVAPADGTACQFKNVDSIIKAWASDNKSGCTSITNTAVTYKVVDGVGHYYINYAAGASASDPATFDAEVFVNSDFSNKVVVFTTFG